MRYVLDSSVALKWVLPEADSAKALRLRDEYRNGLHELLAPDIFPSVIANGLVSAERQKRIRTGESAIPRGLVTCLIGTQQPWLAPRNSGVDCSVSASANRFADPTAYWNLRQIVNRA